MSGLGQTGKWFRVRRADGAIVGVATMPLALALRNLGPGETLRPWAPGINPRHHRWGGRGVGWVAAERLAPARESDPRWLRSTGYPSAGAQLGALMKLTRALLDAPALAGAIANDVRVEAEALLAEIDAVKAAHPIESDPS